MINKKKLLIAGLFLLLAAAFIVWDVFTHRYYIDAFSGATPVAVVKNIPEGLSLKVDGKVKQEYIFSSQALGMFSKIRLRVPEVSPEGELLGAYIYYGIPVLYLMEGVAPIKNETDAFDRPLDMVVIFTSSSGKTVAFSYGELTMIDDNSPVTLAYYRDQLLPSKDPEAYTRNKYKENVKGLRLICPRDMYTNRYLDDVVKITLTVINSPDNLLPVTQKGKKCSSPEITCINNGTATPAIYEEVEIKERTGWFRIGHGRGIKGDSLNTATGYSIRSFLKKNFSECSTNDFFLFVGCDGYRALFSGYEIFNTKAGDSYMIMTSMNGSELENGKAVAATDDFFVDRDVWGVSHIARIQYP